MEILSEVFLRAILGPFPPGREIRYHRGSLPQTI